MVQFVREHREIPDEAMADLLWERFHRSMDIFGVWRLRAFDAEQQRRRGDPPSGPEPTRLVDGDLEQGTGDVAESGATDEPATEESASAEEPSPPEPEGKDVATAATAEEDKVLQPPTFLAKPRKEVSAGLCPSCVWLSRSWSRPASRSGLRGTYHRAIGGSQRTAGLGWSQPRGDGRGRFDSAAPGKRQAYVLVGGMS